MLRTRLSKIAVLAALLMSLAPVAVAHGTSIYNPQWEQEGGTLLGAGEADTVTASAEGTQTLEMGKNTVTCKSLSLLAEKGGKEVERNLKGSAGTSPGTGAETLVYEECEVKGSGSCQINGESAGHARIETEALKDTLVFASKAAAEKEESKTLMLVEPEGTTFAKVSFSGTCPMTGEFAIHGGSLLAENTNGEELNRSRDLKFPTTPLLTYFRNTCGKTEEVKITQPEGREIKEGKEGKDVFEWVVVGIFIIILLAIYIILRIRW